MAAVAVATTQGAEAAGRAHRRPRAGRDFDDEDEDAGRGRPRAARSADDAVRVGLGFAARDAARPGANLAPLADDEDFDEPEIPEYLIAEQRRGRAAASRGRWRWARRSAGGRSAYQSAIERERYGGGRGGGINRYPDVSGRGTGGGAPPRAKPSAGRSWLRRPGRASARRGRATLGTSRGARSRPSSRRCSGPRSASKPAPARRRTRSRPRCRRAADVGPCRRRGAGRRTKPARPPKAGAEAATTRAGDRDRGRAATDRRRRPKRRTTPQAAGRPTPPRPTADADGPAAPRPSAGRRRKTARPAQGGDGAGRRRGRATPGRRAPKRRTTRRGAGRAEPPDRPAHGRGPDPGPSGRARGHRRDDPRPGAARRPARRAAGIGKTTLALDLAAGLLCTAADPATGRAAPAGLPAGRRRASPRPPPARPRGPGPPGRHRRRRAKARGHPRPHRGAGAAAGRGRRAGRDHRGGAPHERGRPGGPAQDARGAAGRDDDRPVRRRRGAAAADHPVALRPAPARAGRRPRHRGDPRRARRRRPADRRPARADRGGRPGLALAWARGPRRPADPRRDRPRAAGPADARPADRLAAVRVARGRLAPPALVTGRRGSAAAVRRGPAAAQARREADAARPSRPPAGRRRRTDADEVGPARTPAAERRRAAEALIGLWTDVARDLALSSGASIGRSATWRLLDDDAAAARGSTRTTLGAFLDRLGRASVLLAGNVSPELVLDDLALAWPAPLGRARRVSRDRRAPGRHRPRPRPGRRVPLLRPAPRAMDLGLTGWVANEPDGSVRCVAEGRGGAGGPARPLETGPAGALVDRVATRGDRPPARSASSASAAAAIAATDG